MDITRRDIHRLTAGAVVGLGAVASVGRAFAQSRESTPPTSSDLMANYPKRYMGAAANLVTGPKGAVIYDEALRQGLAIAYTEPTVEKITEGVWIAGGYSIVNFTVIEAPEGLIVYDTGDNAAEGKRLREVIEEKISKRPIKAIIYSHSHSHYALGAGSLVDDPSSVLVIGHPALNDTVKTNIEGGGAPSAIPELGPVLSARAGVQFNNFLPREGADAALAHVLAVTTAAFLPVTRPVEDGEILDVAGLKLQFFTKHVSDDNSVTVWVPEKKLAINNFFWPGTPNLYSLRGAVYRDPQVWRDGLKVIRNLKPEYLLNTHARAIAGSAVVQGALTNYMDLITLTYDQTLRGVLHGLGPDDLRYFVYQPDALRNAYYNAQSYGESHWFPPAIFLYQMGWFDRDVTQLAKLPTKETARRLVELMGGQDRVVKAAQEALDKKEYAWAAQLVNYAYLISSENKDARRIKADALRMLGQLSVASIGRAFYLTEARALEGKTEIPVLVPPPAEAIAAAPKNFVNYFRVRIDPRKAEAVNKVLTFDFGTGKAGLHIRNGIAEFLPDPDAYDRAADLTLAMNPETWAELYVNATDLATAAKAGKVRVTKGNLADAQALADLFDKFDPKWNVTIPSVNREH